jgi:hypothetical protein
VRACSGSSGPLKNSFKKALKTVQFCAEILGKAVNETVNKASERKWKKVAVFWACYL